MLVSPLADAPSPHFLCRQKLLGARSSKQRELREQSRLRAGGCMHGHGPRRIGDGPACSRIEYMAIAHAMREDVAMAIAARGECAAGEFQEPRGVPGAINILDGDISRRSVAPRT